MERQGQGRLRRSGRSVDGQQDHPDVEGEGTRRHMDRRRDPNSRGMAGSHHTPRRGKVEDEQTPRDKRKPGGHRLAEGAVGWSQWSGEGV